MTTTLPNPPTRITIDTGQICLSALDYGEAPGQTGRPPMLVIHGSTDLAWSMDPVAQAFRDTHHVISIDLRGHGESPHPGAYSTLHYAADLAGVVRTLGWDHPILVGHSLGGHTASLYAALYPHIPSALVLLEGLGPPVSAPSTEPDAQDEMARGLIEMLSSPVGHRTYPDVAAAEARLGVVHPRLSPDRVAMLATHGTRLGPDRGVTWRFDPRVRDWVSSVDPALTERRWQSITCPVFALSGEDAWETYWTARMSPVAAKAGRTRLSDEAFTAKIAAFADLEHIVVSDAGHMIHFDQPDEVNRLTADFLTRRLP